MSDDILMFDPDGQDDEATGALRAAYAAPADAAYWEGLHRRIVDYVIAAEGGWWTGLRAWRPLGFAAAAVALLAIGLGARDTRDAEARAAYEAVLDDTTPTSTFERVRRTAGLSENEAMLQYVLSY
jgi:hypothetical protein